MRLIPVIVYAAACAAMYLGWPNGLSDVQRAVVLYFAVQAALAGAAL